MTKGSDIMTRAGILLIDKDHQRWTLSELCQWINEGVSAILVVEPSAYSITKALTLQKGTLQTIPSTGTPRPLRLMRLTRNLKNTTDSPPTGLRSITSASQVSLDRAEPNWHSNDVVPFKKEVRQFVTNTDDYKTFYVYPGNDGTGIVEAVLSALPAPLSATAGVEELASYEADIGLPPSYDAPLLDYVCYRAQLKDDVSGDAGRAEAHYQQFANAMGIKVQNDKATSAAAQTQRK